MADDDRNSATPPRRLTPAERMLRDFESQRPQPRRRRAPLVGALAGVAALVVLLLLLAPFGRSRRAPLPQPKPATSTGTATPAAKLHEHNASVLFGRARRAAGLGQWVMVLRHLERLRERYAATAFVAAHGPAIAELKAHAEARVTLLPATSVPTTATAVPVEPPVPSLDQALKTWPVVFEDRLDTKACLERALLFRGQYGGHFHIHNGGLAISGVHTNSACWWHCLVGECYAVSLDFYFAGSVPFILLSGPGYGSHPAVGYALRLPVRGDALTLELRRHGALVGLPMRVAPFRAREWHRLDVLRHREHIAVWLDGEMLGQWRDPEPLRGAMHAFVGLGSELGMWGDDRPHYRNLAIRMPQEAADRLEQAPVRRMLDPPISIPPQANGEPLFVDDFAADGFERWTAVQRADAAKVRNGKLVLRGPNAWPVVWRDEPVTGSVAVEFRMAYFPNSEAVNFNARLRLGDYPNPKKPTSFHGWQLGYPGGNGELWLSWADRRGKGRLVAKTAYFPATHGRPCTLRLELSGRRLRVFVNDGFLLEGVAPEPPSPDMGVYPGLYQIYGGSLVERVEAWRIADLPADPLAIAPAGATDFGPRHSALGCFAGAFEAEVAPLLAARRYAEATRVVDGLAVQPRFLLAAELAQIARADVARLARFWAAIEQRNAARPPAQRLDLAKATARQILALLGADALEEAELRLQAALFLLHDKHADPKQALALLDGIADSDDVRRTRALAARLP